MSSPIFIELFQDAQRHLTALASQNTPPWSKELTPEAANILGKEQYSMLARTLSDLKEISITMGRALETIKDLQLAKEPDVERLAEKLMIHSERCKTAADAFSGAQTFIAERNKRRNTERNGPAPSGLNLRR